MIAAGGVKKPRGKTERTGEDALPKRARTWLIIASKSAGDKVRADPVESPEEAAGAAEEEALNSGNDCDRCRRFGLAQTLVNSMPTTVTIATKRIVTILGRSTTGPVRFVRVLGLRRWGS